MDSFKKLFSHRKTTPDATTTAIVPKSDTDHAKSSNKQALTKRASRKATAKKVDPTLGIDDLFAPSFFWRDPFFDFMPVLRTSFERDANMMMLNKSSPGYEITEDDNKYQIAIDVPGVKARDMNVEVEQNGRVLHLSGGRKVQRGTETQETKFDQRFWIGENIDTSKLTANLANGVLVVTGSKKPQTEKKATKITITEGPHSQ